MLMLVVHSDVTNQSSICLWAVMLIDSWRDSNHHSNCCCLWLINDLVHVFAVPCIQNCVLVSTYDAHGTCGVSSYQGAQQDMVDDPLTVYLLPPRWDCIYNELRI